MGLEEGMTMQTDGFNVPVADRVELARIRTRLANKRTFLAWCRTALAFMGFGFLLEKIDVFLASQQHPMPEVLLSELGVLGKFSFVVGPLFVVFAGVRYYWLEKRLGFDGDAKVLLPEVIFMISILIAAILFVWS